MNYLNLDTLLWRACFFLFLCLFISSTQVSAQQPTAPTSITLQIDGLSNDERDVLNKQLIQRGDARIAFACIPAGIIVLQSMEPGRTSDSLRLRTLPGLLSSVAPHRIHEQAVSLTEAEQLCDNARNSN